jgi:hypothetical protein
VAALAALGLVRLLAKSYGLPGLLAGMTALAILLLILLFRVIIPLFEREDRP